MKEEILRAPSKNGKSSFTMGKQRPLTSDQEEGGDRGIFEPEKEEGRGRKTDYLDLREGQFGSLKYTGAH